MAQTPYVTKSLASDGGSSGILTVDSNALFVPESIVYLSSSTQDIKTLKIRALVGSTQFTVYDPASTSYYTNFDCSAYLTTDSAIITQPQQENTLANDDGISSPLTTRGDLYSFDTMPDRLGVGNDGQVLTSDSSQAIGLAWSAAGGSGVTTFAAVGSSPSANGATVSGSTATLQPSDATHPGLLTSGAQVIGGSKAMIAELVIGTDATSNTSLGTTNDIRGATLVSGGTSDQAGTNLTIKTGSGKGAGTPPTIIFQNPHLGSTGTALNAPATSLTLGHDSTLGLAATFTSSGVFTGPATGTNANTGIVSLQGSSANKLLFGAGGGTGTNLLQIPTNQASALALKDSASVSLMTFNTTTSSPLITVAPATTFSGTVTFNGAVITNAGATTGDIILAVSSVGADTTTPIVSGDHSSTPFLTINGAMAVLPSHNDYNIIINVGSGSFSKFQPRSFTGSGTVRIIGNTALATLTTGANTGTCGTGTNIGGGSGVLATIKKPTAAANWTVNNLKGKFFLVTGGTGFQTAPNYAIGVIVSNTIDTAIVNCMTIAGDPNSANDVFSLSIDNTTTFQIISLPTIITPGAAVPGHSCIEFSNCLNTLWLERLTLSGGDSDTSTLYATSCTFVVVSACSFDNSALSNVFGAWGKSCGKFYAFSNYVHGGAGCAEGFEGSELVVFGNFQNTGSGAFASRNMQFTEGLANQMDSVTSANSCWYILQTGLFNDFNTVFTSPSVTPYSFEQCQSGNIYGPTMTGTPTGYGISVLGPSNISTDTKLLGTVNYVLLDDTALDLTSASTGDAFIRNLCQLTYTGA